MYATCNVVNLPVSLVSLLLAKLYTKNHENLYTFVKVIVKNEWHLFYLDMVYSVGNRTVKKLNTLIGNLM